MEYNIIIQLSLLSLTILGFITYYFLQSKDYLNEYRWVNRLSYFFLILYLLSLI